MSGLNVTPVHRNLHTRVTFLYLEFEDVFVILGIAVFANIFGRFLHRDIGGIPLNVILQYIVPVLAIPLLIAFKYGKPRRYVFRRTPFSARPKLLPVGTPTPKVNLNSYSANGGGRVARDKLFFFGAIEHVNRDLPAPVTVPAPVIAELGLPASYANAIPFHQDLYFYMAKADWIVNSRNRLSIRYMHHSNDSPYDNTSAIGGQYLTSQSYNFIDRSHVGAVQVVSAISPNAVNELRTQVDYRGQADVRFSGSGTGPSITILGVANFGGPTGAGMVYNETTPEIADTFSYDFGIRACSN